MSPVAYEEFTKLELHTATVTAAERVEGSEKLLKLQLDLGPELGSRQIVPWGTSPAVWSNPNHYRGEPERA
jgi:tRNA-binding EMAP/Myf-like protein